MPRRGLEPPRPYRHQHLKLARLPIPPSGQQITFGSFKAGMLPCQRDSQANLQVAGAGASGGGILGNWKGMLRLVCRRQGG